MPGGGRRWGAFAVLPYYGAEAFGLHALGVRVLQTGHADMIVAADMFRYQPVAIAVFALGWLAFGAVGVRLLLVARRSTRRRCGSGSCSPESRY